MIRMRSILHADVEPLALKQSIMHETTPGLQRENLQINEKNCFPLFSNNEHNVLYLLGHRIFKILLMYTTIVCPTVEV